MGGTGLFQTVSFLTGFHELSDEYTEAERLRTALGLSGTDLLALLLNQIRRTGIRKKIQLLIYAPNFISVIVLCGMVRMFLSPVGPINSLLGIDTNWMTMPEAFRTIYIASGIWQTAGWSSIMYTARSGKRQQGSGRSGDRGRREHPAADLICTASRH